MTLGTMAVDHEQRIDYDKLRKDRLEKTREQMKKDGLGAVLLFDPDNVRYVTSTKLGEWVNNKLNRYTLLAEGHDPIPVSYTHLDVYKRQGWSSTKYDWRGL